MAKFQNVLIVEDDIFISELYVRALKKAGYNLTAAASGKNGLEMGKSGQFDLMLLDIMIPEMTGIEVLKELREEHNQVPNMKIIITTNLEQDDDIRHAVEQLADGYIIKADITPKLLVRMIQDIENAGRLENKD